MPKRFHFRKILPCLRLALMLLVVFLLLGTAYPPRSPREPDETGKAINAFTFDFLKNLPGDAFQKNAVTSPQSIFHNYAMLYAGSDGETRAELAKTFYFPEDEHALLKNLSEIQNAITQGNIDGTEVALANAIWFGGKTAFKDDYLKKISESGAMLFHDTFNNAEESCEKINRWVSKKTSGRIAGIISPEDLPIKKDSAAHPALVTVSAVSFKADWISQFDSNETKRRTFFKADDTQTQVTAMSGLVDGACSWGADFEYLEIPYKNFSYRMGIFLPNKLLSPAEIVKLVSSDSTNGAFRKNLTPTQARVILPKFEIQTTLGLKTVLSRMGVVTAFGADDGSDLRADFGGMFHRTPATVKIAVSNSRQESVIGVDEKGTKAAAVTYSGGVGIGCSAGSPPVNFHADHPFLFFIIHDASQTILFAGWYNGVEE